MFIHINTSRNRKLPIKIDKERAFLFCNTFFKRPLLTLTQLLSDSSPKAFLVPHRLWINLRQTVGLFGLSVLERASQRQHQCV